MTGKRALYRRKVCTKTPCSVLCLTGIYIFQFSNDIRRIMYTTNIIEGLNRQYRKVTKTKSVFPSDAALEKMLYLASENVIKKWTQRYRNWDQVLNQLIVLYGERLTNYL